MVLASDEAYSELYFGDEPPASVLQVGDLRNVVVFNTLSKRSSMPGYRSGFAAGDPEIVAALKRYRPNVGVAPQEFVQRAAIAAWRDEQHDDDVREVYRAKRDVVLPAFEALGMRHAGGDASFFLWLALPEGELIVNSSRGGGSKDTWVLAGGRVHVQQQTQAPLPEVHAPPLDTGPAIESRKAQMEQQQQAGDSAC